MMIQSTLAIATTHGTANLCWESAGGGGGVEIKRDELWVYIATPHPPTPRWCHPPNVFLPKKFPQNIVGFNVGGNLNVHAHQVISSIAPRGGGGGGGVMTFFIIVSFIFKQMKFSQGSWTFLLKYRGCRDKNVEITRGKCIEIIWNLPGHRGLCQHSVEMVRGWDRGGWVYHHLVVLLCIFTWPTCLNSDTQYYS